jgi:hypothetical protein
MRNGYDRLTMADSSFIHRAHASEWQGEVLGHKTRKEGEK